MQPRSLKGIAFAAALVTTALALVSPLGAAEQNAYVVTNLVSSGPAVPAATHDASLVNGWGLTASSGSPWWVADNGANVSTLYNGNTGAKLGLTVTVLGGPTGTVFNIAGAGFAVPCGASSRFLFASEDGKIRGWPSSGDAQETAAQSPVPFAKYKGLAIAVTGDGPRLYATDFHNGRVDVWDSSWNLITSATFTDPSIPAGYGPFGIQRIGETIFVTYAKQDADAAGRYSGGSSSTLPAPPFGRGRRGSRTPMSGSAGGSSSQELGTVCSQRRRRKAISRLKRFGCRQRGFSIAAIVSVARCARAFSRAQG